MYQPSTINSIIASGETSLDFICIPLPPPKKKVLKLVGVVNHVFDRRGSLQ